MVASSGVASLLLPGGRTTHSRFRIPCELDETSTCDIKRGTMLAELIEASSLIIWDEAFMTHRNAFEALDLSLRDLLSLKSAQFATIPFGGKGQIIFFYRTYFRERCRRKCKHLPLCRRAEKKW
jgi:ATP-dependent DNA helicase PIF1